MKSLSLDAFEKLLDPRYHQYGSLTKSVTRWSKRIYHPFIYRRDAHIVEVFRELLDHALYPLVDRRLNIVFGLPSSHGFARSELYLYFKYGTTPPQEHINSDIAMDKFVTEGCGYFISKTTPKTILAGTAYRPDRYDKLVFDQYRVDTYVA